MIWPNMASTLGPLPLGDETGGDARGRREEDMMGEKRDEKREKRGDDDTYYKVSGEVNDAQSGHVDHDPGHNKSSAEATK
jgi:hypothetical protein